MDWFALITQAWRAAAKIKSNPTPDQCQREYRTWMINCFAS
jgi:hypothetical protein